MLDSTTIYTTQDPNSDAALIDVALQVRDWWEGEHPDELVENVTVYRGPYGFGATIHRQRKRMFRRPTRLPDMPIAVAVKPSKDAPQYRAEDVENVRRIDHRTGAVISYRPGENPEHRKPNTEEN